MPGQSRTLVRRQTIKFDHRSSVDEWVQLKKRDLQRQIAIEFHRSSTAAMPAT